MSDNSKMVQELYLQWQTNRKLYSDLLNATIFNDLEQPLTQFSGSRYYLTLHIS